MRSAAIEVVLTTPAPKLSRNAGPRKVPVKNEPTVTLMSVIVIPVLNPYSMSAVRVIMLDSPKRSQGIGVGISFSKPCRAIAYAASRAILRLSCDCIYLRVFTGTSIHSHNYSVRKADKSTFVYPPLFYA